MAGGRWRRRGAAFGLAFLALPVLSGCGEAVDRRPQGGTAVLVMAGAPAVANPFAATDTYSHELARHLLFLPLFGFDGSLEIEPRLAESWEAEGDSAVLIRLHRGVPWSDGRRTTADDVVFTLERALDPASGYANREALEHLAGATAVDSYTVRLTVGPVRDPLQPLALLPILPRHVLDTVAAEALRQTPFNRSPVTNGPFTVVEARPPDRWVLARNDSFPAALGGPPNLSRLVWRAVPESDAQLAELQAGEAHMVVGVRADAFDRLRARPGFDGVERPTLSYTGIAWNGRRPPLDDARVRRALTLALDRQEVVDALRGGYGSPADGPIPPDHWAHGGETDPLPYDTAGSRRLLAEAGLADRDGDGTLEREDGAPFVVRLLLPAGSDFNRDLAQVVQSQLARVGVRLELRPLEFSTLVETITGPDRDYDAVLIGLDADPRLDLRGLYHSAHAADGPFQLAGYANPAMDEVLDRLDRTTDRGAAAELFGRAQRILREEQPWTYLYFGRELILTRASLGGVEADLRGALHSAPGWWLESGRAAEPEG